MNEKNVRNCSNDRGTAMDILVGYTGFVGSNLALSHKFDLLFNTKNITESYGTRPDLLLYAGVTGTKFIANAYPQRDKEVIDSAIQNITKIDAKKTVLISTVDIYDKLDCSEKYIPEKSQFSVYGNHRLYLENWVKSHLSDYHIVRLPALYGRNLKKNYVFDLINVVPTMLTVERFQSIKKELNIEFDYEMGEDGLYHFSCNDRQRIGNLRKDFLAYGFNAMSFTDSRAEYQFYNLGWLWEHIGVAMDNNIRVINLVTEPIDASLLYARIYNEEFDNLMDSIPVKYSVKTVYDKIYGGSKGYICKKEDVLADLMNYIHSQIIRNCQ